MRELCQVQVVEKTGVAERDMLRILNTFQKTLVFSRCRSSSQCQMLGQQSGMDIATSLY